MRAIRFVLASLVLIALAAIVWGLSRDPETTTLDAAARANVPGKYATLAGGVTRYELAGPDTGRVVVLVHGFSVPYYIWDSSVVALTKAGRRVLRYDVFGRGWSDRPDAAYDGHFYDVQIEALLDSLRIKQPVDLVGLSFGGYITAHFAATHRDRVNTLTLVDPVSTSGNPLPWYITAPVLGQFLFQAMAVPGMAKGQPGDFLHPEHFPDWVSRYEPQMKFKGFGRSLLRSQVTRGQTDFNALFSAIAKQGIPALLVWGKQDPTVPIANADIIKRAIPDVTFVPIDSSGHLPHMEQSAATHSAMLGFWAKHR